MSILEELAADVARWDAARARSQQTEPGASQTFACRAATVLRANGIPESDPRLSWQAVVGTAIHGVIDEAREQAGEQRLTYRGVPCTIDEIAPPVVRDWKSKDTAAEIATVRRDGPRDGQVGQVMLGAAAAIDAGHEITTVELVFVPRAGRLEDGWVWSAPFSRDIADAAADWHETVRKLIDERAGLPAVEQVDGLRDEPPSFCWAYCPFVTACRGERPEHPPVDEGVADVAAEYLEAKALEDEVKVRLAKAKAFLDRYDDLSSVGLRWQGGNPLKGDEVDMDAVAFLLGGNLPMKPREGFSARSLRRLS